jgi:hypothetical protein
MSDTGSTTGRVLEGAGQSVLDSLTAEGVYFGRVDGV